MEKPKRNKTLFAAALLFILATSAYAVSPKVDKTASAKGRSPRVLLQKAIYAEETEGDLDKAIELYQQTIDRAGRIQRIAAQATYQLGMCYLKKGEKKKAAEYLQLVSNYPTQKAIVAKAKQQLKELKPQKVGSIFEEISTQVVGHLAERYSKLTTEANRISLPCNAHIYYVDADFKVYSGGMSYYYNRDGRSIAGKVKLGGTSYPNQTLYDTNGKKLNTEIVPDKNRNNFYHIYWIPDEPLSPGEALYYGWSKNNTSKLSAIGPADKGLLTMQNQYGSKVMETFFLVLPNDLYIPEGNATAVWEVDDFMVHSWTQEVGRNANHLVNVVIQKKPKIENARTVIESFLSEAIAGNNSKAIKLVKPGSAVDQQVGDLHEFSRGKQIQITTVHANDRIALAFTDEFTGDDGQVAMLEFTLTRQRGIWMVEDIDLENTAKAKSNLSDFLKNNPDAGEVSTQISGKITDPKEWVQGLVEDYFKHNYRDITSRKTIEWGNPVTDATGNVSISYKYEMTIWDKDKYLTNELFTFDKNGKYLSVRKVEGFPKPLGKVKVSPEDVSSKESVKKLVEKFFSRNYRDITSRKTIEWGELSRYPGGNVSIRYKFEAVIRGSDKCIINKVFTFDKNGQYVSAEDVGAFPIKTDLEKGKDENGSFRTPADTIVNFMAAAIKLDTNKAMTFVAPDSHDYDDIKETLEDSENPFNIMYRKLDSSKRVKIIKINIMDTMCSAVWRITFKEDFTIEGKTFKKGDTIDLDGNLHKYGDKWLITGI